MELSRTDLFRARWTNDIHDEWTRNVIKDRPDIPVEKIQATRDAMDRGAEGCLIDGYHDLIPSLNLPDVNDRHVLAAAIACGADAIVTFNLKDFPAAVLDQYGIEAIHPDDFVADLIDLNAARVIQSVKKIRDRLKKPKMTADEYINSLAKQGLSKTIKFLEGCKPII